MLYCFDMDESPTRIERLRQHMLDAFGGSQKTIAAKLDRQADYISRLLNGKTRLSGDLAREFELLLGLPKYWLDGETSPSSGNPRIEHAVKLLREMEPAQLDMAVKILHTIVEPTERQNGGEHTG